MPSRRAARARVAAALGERALERARARRRRARAGAPAPARAAGASARARAAGSAKSRGARAARRAPARAPTRSRSRARARCRASRARASAWSASGSKPERATSGAPVLLEEVLREERDVVAPLAQRRQRQAHDVQAVVEVLPEAARRHHLARGRGCVAPITRMSTGSAAAAAERAHLARLERAQQLGLHRQRDLTDLVEEERPAARDAEQPGRADRAR